MPLISNTRVDHETCRSAIANVGKQPICAFPRILWPQAVPVIHLILVLCSSGNPVCSSIPCGPVALFAATVQAIAEGTWRA